MNTTTIKNDFTGYEATIRHQGAFPAVSTVKKHMRASKASDCTSWTRMFQGSKEIELIDTGNGLRFVAR